MVRLTFKCLVCVENKSRESDGATLILAGSNANNLQGSENSMGNVQDSGFTTGESRITRPSHLAEVLQSTRQLLIGEVADCLSVCSFTFLSCGLFRKPFMSLPTLTSLNQCLWKLLHHFMGLFNRNLQAM